MLNDPSKEDAQERVFNEFGKLLKIEFTDKSIDDQPLDLVEYLSPLMHVSEIVDSYY